MLGCVWRAGQVFPGPQGKREGGSVSGGGGEACPTPAPGLFCPLPGAELRGELGSLLPWTLSQQALLGPGPPAHLVLAQLIKLLTTCGPDSSASSLEAGHPRPSLGISSQCLHINTFQLRGSPAPSFLGALGFVPATQQRTSPEK